MAKPRPIGSSRKELDKNSVEQLSFRMPAYKKRQFAALLAEQGLEIKEVLVEFIDEFIKHRGKIGVVPLEDTDSPRSAPRSNLGKRGSGSDDVT